MKEILSEIKELERIAARQPSWKQDLQGDPENVYQVTFNLAVKNDLKDSEMGKIRDGVADFLQKLLWHENFPDLNNAIKIRKKN